jgi:type IV pilus assembly protein PilC
MMPMNDTHSQAPIVIGERSPWTSLFIEPVKWFIPAIVFIAVISAITGLIFTPLVIVGGPIIAFLLAYSVNRMLRVRSRQRAMSILSYLENAARLNFPFDSYLLAAELAERGSLRAAIRHLRANLSRGFSVVNALMTAVPEFPEPLAAQLAVAERLGRLCPTLTRIVAEERRRRPSVRDDLSPMYRLYPAIVLFAVISILTFLTIFVVPKFREIFKDFKVSLPEVTVFLLKITSFFSDDIPLAPTLLVLLAIIVIMAVGLQLERIFTTNAPVQVVRDAADWFTWRLPLLRHLQRDRAIAASSQVIAEALRAGLPLPRAIELALALPTNRFFRRSLDRWRTNLITGMPVAQAAALAGLPPLFLGFLGPATDSRAAASPDSLPDLFEFLARYYRDRFSRIDILLRAAFEPAMVLCMGVLVGFTVVALFVPVVKLLNNVASFYPTSPL